MRIIFRADASRECGTGHVLRSSALAEEAISRGIDCVFVGTFGGISWVENRIKTLGFSKIVEYPKDYLFETHNDILVVDSYLIEPEDPFIQPSKWRYIVNIADPETPSYKCDLIVHSGLDESWLEGGATPFLSGPQNILIRKTISKVSSANNDTSRSTNVMIVGGGSDPFGLCKHIAKLLDGFDLPVSAFFMSNDSIASQSHNKFTTIPVGPEMDQIISKIDVVITTSGTSCLEFVAREIPTGVVSVADNQDAYYLDLGNRKVVQQLGRFRQDSGWEINHKLLEEFIYSKELKERLKTNCKDLIDLNGPKRILDFILVQNVIAQ